MTHQPQDGFPEVSPAPAATMDQSPDGRTFTIRFDQDSVRRTVIATVAILVTYSILKWLWDSASHFIFLFMLAWLLSIAMEPSVAWLANHGVKRGMASGLAILGIIATSSIFLGLFGGILVTQSAALIQELPTTIVTVVNWLNSTFHLQLDPSHILNSLNIDAGKIAEWVRHHCDVLYIPWPLRRNSGDSVRGVDPGTSHNDRDGRQLVELDLPPSTGPVTYSQLTQY